MRKYQIRNINKKRKWQIRNIAKKRKLQIRNIAKKIKCQIRNTDRKRRESDLVLQCNTQQTHGAYGTMLYF